MNYEEKYKNALRWIESIYPTLQHEQQMEAEGVFPEIVESEDERIRKWCISHFKAAIRVTKDHAEYQEYLNNKVIPWLEKQGEQKSTAYDKKLKKIEKQDTPKDYNSIDPHFGKPIETESKFKVGDWIFSPAWGTARIIGTGIIGVNDSDFLLEYTDGKKEYLPNEFVNSGFDKWNIEDAKDGDVLVNGSNIFIFHFLNDTRLMGYGHVNTDDGRFYDDIGKNECFCLIDAVVNPATKVQRDRLFQKMKETGYEWDADRKELKRIE